MSLSTEIADDLLGGATSSRDVQIAARLAWRYYGQVHFLDVTLGALLRLLQAGDKAAALAFCAEAIREVDRMTGDNDPPSGQLPGGSRLAN